jgi:hypothetical protein
VETFTVIDNNIARVATPQIAAVHGTALNLYIPVLCHQLGLQVSNP